MFPNIPREHTQFVSLALVTIGTAVMITTPEMLTGIALIVLSSWVLMISESALHAKVQIEMSSALEKLRRKQECEIEELLYFLKDTQISSEPFKSMDGAKRLCQSIGYPAMVLTANHQIIKANRLMHNTLGWQKDQLHGVPAHFINHPSVMSKIGEVMATSGNIRKKSMVTQYVYLHKTGKKIYGQMDAHEVSPEGLLEGYFVVFHPESENALSREEIQSLTS